MKKIIASLVGFLIVLPSLAANPSLDYLARDELLEKFISYIPIKENIYNCNQIVYNYSFSQQAIKSCGFSRISSAADTGNVMCHSWAISKSDGSLGKIRSIAKEAEKDFKEKLFPPKKGSAICSSILDNYSDFIIE